MALKRPLLPLRRTLLLRMPMSTTSDFAWISSTEQIKRPACNIISENFNHSALLVHFYNYLKPFRFFKMSFPSGGREKCFLIYLDRILFFSWGYAVGLVQNAIFTERKKKQLTIQTIFYTVITYQAYHYVYV